MMGLVDFTALVYEPAYLIAGSDAYLEFGSTAGPIPLTVVDMTAGVAVNDQHLQTIKPAFAVMAAELIANGVALSDLPSARLIANGKTYRVESHEVRPSPNGETDGEVYLYPIEA